MFVVLRLRQTAYFQEDVDSSPAIAIAETILNIHHLILTVKREPQKDMFLL